MLNANDYFNSTKEYLEQILTTQRENIKEAAVMIGDCMAKDGIVQLFGAYHNRAFAMELGYRAGGLMPYHQINLNDLALRGVLKAEELYQPNFLDREDIVDPLLSLYQIEKQDMFIMVADAGYNYSIIDLALKVKANNHKLIVITSKASIPLINSNHPSNKLLYEIADLVIDNCAPCPDTILPFQDMAITQVSGICGNMIAQMITAEIYNYLTNKGLEAPVLLSANITGADVHNRKISDKYLGRWNS